MANVYSKGILFAVAACFIWGFIFIVPQCIQGFNSFEISLGRYFFYGLVSLIFFLKLKWQGKGSYPLKIWMIASLFSLASTIIYYTALILGLRFATPAICTLIIGICPVIIAFYGNLREKMCKVNKLIFPAALILLGLLIINVPYIDFDQLKLSYFLGLLWSFLALSVWSWYVVANAKFLKENSKITGSDWSTLIGLTTLFWIALSCLICGIIPGEQLQLKKYFLLNSELYCFLGGSAVLGLICSWLGAFLWNKATVYLPVSLAGQLTIFETIFGLLFVYLYAQKLPSASEFLGIVFLISSVIYGIRLFTNLSHTTANSNP